MVKTEVEPILRNYPDARRDALIPILQEVQEVNGYLSRDAIVQIGRHLGLPASKVYGVATFYNQFRFHPLGRHHIQVCRGTACHVKGSAAVLDEVERTLGIQAGETSRDGMFSLEVVACVGVCGLSPVITINGEYHTGVTAQGMKAILNSCRREATDDGNGA
ncbi:MAG: NADH-quinone oxidoreductase subunit NuoE [Candidatus Brocadiae bacterium]|nr:NADH-quinone oxidoreductase subunit NuoE [Candidatus Brocadiia bacterium]